MNWLDYAILIVLIYGAVNGMQKGLITTVTRLVSFVLSIFIAKTYYPVMTEFIIKNTDIEEKLMNIVFNKNISSKLIDMPLGAVSAISKGQGITNNINSFVTVSILNSISLFVLFAGCSIAIIALQVVLNGVFKLPGLNETNRLGGLIIGISLSVLGLMIAFAVLIPVINIGSWEFMRVSIQESNLAKYFYSYNFILNTILNGAMKFII